MDSGAERHVVGHGQQPDMRTMNGAEDQAPVVVVADLFRGKVHHGHHLSSNQAPECGPPQAGMWP